jgi:hypothetical protein
MKKYVVKTLLVILAVRLSTGCATIIHGTTQNIDISSAPDDAMVWVDGARIGTTPARLTLKRGDIHLIQLEKEGYKNATIKIDKSVSAWIIGNVVFGGLIGCGIDFISGGAYELKPERVDVNLTKLAAMGGQTLHITSDDFNEIRFVDDAGTPLIVAHIQWID